MSLCEPAGIVSCTARHQRGIECRCLAGNFHKVIHWPVEVSCWRRWWRELERGPSLVSLLWWLWNIPWGCWCFWPDHSDLYASGWPRWGSRGHFRYSRNCHRYFLWTVSTVLSARLIHGLLLVSAWGCCMHKGRQFSLTWIMVMQSEPGEQISPSSAVLDFFAIFVKPLFVPLCGDPRDFFRGLNGTIQHNTVQ